MRHKLFFFFFLHKTSLVPYVYGMHTVWHITLLMYFSEFQIFGLYKCKQYHC